MINFCRNGLRRESTLGGKTVVDWSLVDELDVEDREDRRGDM